MKDSYQNENKEQFLLRTNIPHSPNQYTFYKWITLLVYWYLHLILIPVLILNFVTIINADISICYLYWFQHLKSVSVLIPNTYNNWYGVRVLVQVSLPIPDAGASRAIPVYNQYIADLLTCVLSLVCTVCCTPDSGCHTRTTAYSTCFNLTTLTEWHPEDRGQEEAHLQAGPGRVHRPREDRERLCEERRRGSGLCAWRQPAGREEEMSLAGPHLDPLVVFLTLTLVPPSRVLWRWWSRTPTSWPAGPKEPWDWREPTRNCVTHRYFESWLSVVVSVEVVLLLVYSTIQYSAVY